MSSNSLFFKNKATSSQTWTSGSGSWTVPAGVYQVWVELVGGGGSGGRFATSNDSDDRLFAFGGEAGQVVTTMVPTTPGASISYSIGSGGSSISADGPGNAGANTAFGSIRAGGGAGGGSKKDDLGDVTPVYTVNESGRGIGRNGFRANGGSTATTAPSLPSTPGQTAKGGDGCYGAGGNGSTTGNGSAGGVGAGGGGSTGGNSGAGGAGRIQIWWVVE